MGMQRRHDVLLFAREETLNAGVEWKLLMEMQNVIDC